MSLSRREFLKSTVAGTSLGWQTLRSTASSTNTVEDVGGEVHDAAWEIRVPISLSEVQGRRTTEGDLALHPGESVRIKPVLQEQIRERTWRLRLVGTVDVDSRLRTEAGFPSFYQLIDDALDSVTTHHRTYSLALRSNGEFYPRRAYFRVMWNTTAKERERVLKIWARKEAVAKISGGEVGMEVAVYRKRPGRNVGDLTDSPENVYFLDIGEGTCDWREYSLPVRLQGDIACLLFTAVGKGFSGGVWLEDPQFPGPDGLNSLPPFAPARPNGPYRNWLGENLSEKEWPKFRLALNGKEFFHGKLFQPIYSWPAAEVYVPSELLRSGENDLTIQLTSSYHQPLSYFVRHLEWLRIPDGSLEVVSCPELVEAGSEFPVLIKTRDPGLRSRVFILPVPGKEQAGITAVQPELIFPDAGLQFVRFRAGRAGAGGTIRFRFEGEERQAVVDRVVNREQDGVLVGSGDSLYATADREGLQRFHTWYLHHSIGNSIVYRPIYRWGGTQVRDPLAWQEAKRFCEAAGLKYSLILDGREIPETDGNPTDEMLAGPLFRGGQLHEFDGYFDYLGHEPTVSCRLPDEELFWDVYERFPARGRAGAMTESDPQVRGAGPMKPLNYDPLRAHDMREGAEYFIENLRRQLPMAERHSGPSTLFKYFFQAGFKWLAAETMYGPHEIILGALRGASLAYGQPRYGAHIAAEWSTTPHDDRAAFRRYFLALATPYIHGAEHIYIEDGLWHMEEGLSADDRFSPACQGHLKVHQDFYRFTRAHSRRGQMRVPLAFLQGNYDGWTCFTRAFVWGQTGPEWEFAEPEKSWDLLNVFFPRSVLGPIYREPCPHESVGFFSGTPFGTADIVPIEADVGTLLKYSTLIFLGWNTADTDQVERLLGYVEAGGHLILALPHLSMETRRKQSPLPLSGPQVQRLLGLEIRGLKTSSGKYIARQVADQGLVTVLRGRKLQLADVVLAGAVPRVVDEVGSPLLAERKLGKGQVTFINVAAYPGDAALEGVYKELLCESGRRVLAEESASVWAKGSEDTSFAVYDWGISAKPPISTVYFLNVNWWSDPPQNSQAHLLWRGAEVPLEISPGRIHMVTVAGDWGIWTQDIDTDVIDLQPETHSVLISLQGQGSTQLRVLYRPKAQSGAHFTLTGKSSHGPLPLEALPVAGLWRAELVMAGPEQLTITVVSD